MEANKKITNLSYLTSAHVVKVNTLLNAKRCEILPKRRFLEINSVIGLKQIIKNNYEIFIFY